MVNQDTARIVVGIIEKDDSSPFGGDHLLRWRHANHAERLPHYQGKKSFGRSVVRRRQHYMYTSPLTVKSMVIKTKGVKFMPFWLSVVNLANGVVWLIYTLIKIDPWIVVPNGLGAVSGLVQLILYAVYYRLLIGMIKTRKKLNSQHRY